MASKKDWAVKSHIAEYVNLTDEIKVRMDFQYRLTNYAILINGATITLYSVDEGNFIAEHLFILLLISILNATLGLSVVSSALFTQAQGKYIQEILAPKLQKIIGSQNKPELAVLGWEEFRIKHDLFYFLRGISSAGKYLPLISSIILNAIYYLSRDAALADWKFIELALFFCACLLSVSILSLLLVNTSFMYTRSKYTNQETATDKKKNAL